MQYYKANSSSLEDENDELEARALAHLAKAQGKPVAFAIRSNAHFDPSHDEDCPARGYAVSFGPNDFLHIKEKLNDDWWIGRLVKEGCGLGFVPSPINMESRRIRDANLFQLLSEEQSPGGNQSKKDKRRLFARFRQTQPYDVVPAVRPVILIGPSLKGFEVTDMMQKAIFVFLKDRFKDRIIITHVTADISLAKEAEQADPVGGSRRSGLIDRSEVNRRLGQHIDEVSLEVERVYELAKTMQLLVLDCDTINFPEQIARSSLAPILVYLKMASPKVLHRLIKSRGRGQVRHMNAQLSALDRLNQMPIDAFDVVLEESKLEAACDHLARYLENYWRAVHTSNNQGKVAWQTPPRHFTQAKQPEHLDDTPSENDYERNHRQMNLPNGHLIQANGDVYPPSRHINQKLHLDNGYLHDQNYLAR